ncbi:MAG: hypothetical protein ACOCRO_09740, partial [Halanaerobiales bacterium]
SQLMEDFAEAMSSGTAEEAQEIMMKIRDNARRVGGRMSAELLTIPIDMEEEQDESPNQPSEPSRPYMAEGDVGYYRENHTRDIERMFTGRFIDEEPEIETTDSSGESINIGEVELTHEEELIFDKIDWTSRYKENNSKEDRIIEY